jgi:lysozyme
VGIGKRIGPKGADLSDYKFTVSKSIAYAWLEEEVEIVEHALNSYRWFNKLDDDRKTILLSMGYQLGVTGLLGFKLMIEAIEIEHWDAAAAEARDSLWYKQTTHRAARHVSVISGNSIDIVYRNM